MKFPIWIKPGAWGVVLGAVLSVSLGFYQFGWSSAATTQRIAQEQARAAVLTAMVPFCLAKAKGDADPDHMAKLRAETSAYARSDLVRTAGWATMPGMSAPDTDLARACSERLAAAG
jgi:hypothetical protein